MFFVLTLETPKGLGLYRGLYREYIRMMEKKMEATISDFRFLISLWVHGSGIKLLH